MKFNNSKISPSNLNWGLLLFRASFGVLMIVNHGWSKIVKYETLKDEFFNFLNLGSHISLILTLFAEILCALFLILGLYTRLALIPLIIAMLVAMYVKNWDIFAGAEMSFLYCISFLVLFITGPGKYSIDARMTKRSYF